MKKEKINLRVLQKIKDVSLLNGEFVLRSGATSNEYFDKYKFESDPELLCAIAIELSKLIPQDTEILAGLELGGIPIVTALSIYTGLRASYVRKNRKEYGTSKLAEGCDIVNKNVLIIEDVITSGGQVIESVKELRKLGSKIEYVMCVIDREDGGRENLLANDIKMISLFTRTDLKTKTI